MPLQQNIWIFRSTLFIAASMSIGSLLLYFFGFTSFFRLCITLTTIEVVLLACLFWWALTICWIEAKQLLVSGLWAGCLATLAYDVVRVPIVHAGIPVFKAISYFGTVLLNQDRPSAMSELVGWGYHLSNGVSFSLMYVALAVRPSLITAVLWGLSLEGAMLLTPYAEVFGYQRDARFFAITIGSHAVYGLVLWLGLRGYRKALIGWRPGLLGACVALVSLGASVIGADFNRLYGKDISKSPPPYMGSHLYTVWNLPEPDRIAAIWLMKRFVDREAVFYFIEPFERVKYGTPFDMPEASVRRSGTQSATQVLLSALAFNDPKLTELGRITGLIEITPWMLESDQRAALFVEHLRRTAGSQCGKSMTNTCLPTLLRDLDDWYRD